MGGWQEKILWDSKKRRNEALDCFVYALAALRISISAGGWISSALLASLQEEGWCSNQQENTGRLRPCLIKGG